MATFELQIDTEGYAKCPSNIIVEEAKLILKPVGILSNNYNKQGLKKVERTFVPAKGAPLVLNSDIMRQTDYRLPVEEAKNMEYFHVKTTRLGESLFDHINHVITEGYDQKLHRDDRQHAKMHGLRVNDEENRRSVPATSNAAYGNPTRIKLEKNDKQHCHRELCREEFYGRNGVNFSSKEE